MTRFEKLSSGFWEEGRGGVLELTLKGKRHFCKHEHWKIKHYDAKGNPNVMQCIYCGKLNNL